MQNKAAVGRANDAKFIDQPDSNLREIPTETSIQKPDSYYIDSINKVVCADSDLLVQDNSNNTYEEDTYFCYNNGTNGNPKKLVHWKKVEGLWIKRHLTNSSEYKEINNTLINIIKKENYVVFGDYGLNYYLKFFPK
jgi:hypothetical protein